MSTSLPALTTTERAKFLDILSLLSSDEVGIDKKRIALIPLREENKEKALPGEIIINGENGWIGTRDSNGNIITCVNAGMSDRITTNEDYLKHLSFTLANMMSGSGTDIINRWMHPYGNSFSSLASHIGVTTVRPINLTAPLAKTDGTLLVFPHLDRVHIRGKVGEYASRIRTNVKIELYTTSIERNLPFSWALFNTDNSKFHTTNYPFRRGSFIFPATAIDSYTISLPVNLPNTEYGIFICPQTTTNGSLGEFWIQKGTNNFTINFTGKLISNINFNYFLVYYGATPPTYDEINFPFLVRKTQFQTDDATADVGFPINLKNNNYSVFSTVISPIDGKFGDLFSVNKELGKCTLGRTGSSSSATVESIIFAPPSFSMII